MYFSLIRWSVKEEEEEANMKPLTSSVSLTHFQIIDCHGEDVV